MFPLVCMAITKIENSDLSDRAKCDKSGCKLVVYDVSLHNRHIILTFAEKRQYVVLNK